MKTNSDNPITKDLHSRSIWDYSLNLQFLSSIGPDFGVELGVWKGSTFQIIDKYCKKAIGFDIYDYGNFWEDQWDIRVMDVKKITKKDLDGKEIDFAHIDASKDFTQVISAIQIMRDNLSPDGIICVADYMTHRDVFIGTQYFLQENREFSIKLRGYNQVYLVKSAGADLIKDVISKFDKKTIKALKLETTYSINIIPKNFHTDIDFAIKTQENISEDLKKFYKNFNR